MSSTLRRTGATLAAGLFAAGLVTAGTSTAIAKGGDDDVQTAGNCSAGADWKLKAKEDDGRIEIEYEVDSNVNGQKWRVRITDNGNVVFNGSRTTKGPSGSFEVERKVTNLAGVDKFVGFARNAATGETCRGRLNFPG